jgi:AcrR family transcriptional regulator
MLTEHGTDRRRGSLDGPILDTAAALFLRDGYAGTHMVEVAEAAGVSIATLYRYFKSKDVLLDSAFRREVERIEGRWRDEAWDLPDAQDRLVRYARVLHGHTLDWALDDRALGLLLVMAETPGLLYRFLLDKVEVHERWIEGSLLELLDDAKWITTHAVTSATGFYALLIRWGRGRLMQGQPDLPRQVPKSLPESERGLHVARACDFTAEELAEWYTKLGLRSWGLAPELVEDTLLRALSLAVSETGG